MPKAKKPSLKKTIQKVREKKPLWNGPEEDGITQSLLNLFMMCRERFRVRVVEGIRPADRFNKTIEYGNMWHECEEAHAMGEPHELRLKTYCQKLIQKYPMDQQEIEKWYQVCKVQFPVYVDYWKHHPDVKKRTPLLAEEVFSVPYTLPSGRIVRLKGKWDSVDLVGKGRNAKIWLQENKTKGDIDEMAVEHRLTFDLQSMFYLVALQTDLRQPMNALAMDMSLIGSKTPIAGIRYNVIRRPLSGGRGSIRQKKGSKNVRPETAEEFYQRLANDYIKAEPEYWFMRWNVLVSQAEIENFKLKFLNPILEQLCDWWDWVSTGDVWNDETTPNKLHWMSPFGLYNPLAEGRGTELDEYLMTGNRVGLESAELFPEL